MTLLCGPYCLPVPAIGRDRVPRTNEGRGLVMLGLDHVPRVIGMLIL